MVRFHLSPPKDYQKKEDSQLAQDKRVVQGKRRKIDEIIHWYIEEILLKFDTAIRSLDEAK